MIGYETRMLQREDFLNDKVDAGEIGVGHTVTAIYELTPVGSGAERIAPLRYQDEEAKPGTEFAGEYAYLKIRYKLPDSDTSTEIVRAVIQADAFESVQALLRERCDSLPRLPPSVSSCAAGATPRISTTTTWSHLRKMRGARTRSVTEASSSASFAWPDPRPP